MNFIDILQKLLPFTYSKNNETFVGISGMEGSDWIITIAFIILMGIFIFKLISLWVVGGKKDKDRLKSLLNILKNDDKSLIDEELNALDDSRINTTWENFKRGLINDGNELRRVYDADFFFNKSSLLEKVGANSFANIPSLLLSLGLLGTFIGLFYGLVQLNLDDAETLKESMRTLIHASGAKFASSIWGLGLSVIFGFLTRIHEKNLESLIHEIQDEINQKYPLQLSEQSLINQEKNNQSIIEILTSHSPYLKKLEKLDKLEKIENGITDINEILEKQRDIMQSLAINIAKNLRETLANSILNAMSEALKNLESHIGGTPDDTLHHRITQMSGGIGDEFTTQLQDIMNSINRQIGESIGQDTSNLRESISGLNSTLAQFKANLTEQNTQISSLISNLEMRINAQSESANLTTQAIADNATKAGTQITQALSPINESVTSIETLNDQLTALLSHITNFNQSTEHLKDTAINTNQASDKLSLNVKGLDESQKALDSAMSKLATGLTSASDDINEVPTKLLEVVNKSSSIASNTQDAYTTIANNFKQLIERNGESIAKLENSLLQYQQLTQENIAESLQHIDAGLKKNMQEYLKYINNYQESANRNIEKTLATFDGQLASFAQDLASAVGELNDAIDSLNDRLNRNNRR